MNFFASSPDFFSDIFFCSLFIFLLFFSFDPGGKTQNIPIFNQTEHTYTVRMLWQHAKQVVFQTEGQRFEQLSCGMFCSQYCMWLNRALFKHHWTRLFKAETFTHQTLLELQGQFFLNEFLPLSLESSLLSLMLHVPSPCIPLPRGL